MACNAGPVIALAKINALTLLHHLAESVKIPETVLHEVLTKPGLDADRILADTRLWLQPATLSDEVNPAVKLATRNLDEGERDVIALAATFPAPAVALLDDAADRRVARRLGIHVVGFVGILLLAKKCQIIKSVSPMLFEARDQGYWLSDKLIDAVKKLAAE